MRRKYLIVKDVRDCKGNPGSYVVFGSVVLDDRNVPTVEAVTLDEQTATGIRQVMREHGADAGDKKP